MSIDDHRIPDGQIPQTPPPAPLPTAQTPPRGPETVQSVGRSGGAKAIVIATAVVGGIALLGTGGTAAAAAVSDLSRADSRQTAAADGIEVLDLDASASDVTVRFGDVEEAVLTVTGSRGDWTLERDGDELRVRSPHTVFDWWFGGSWFDGEERVQLMLPESLRADAIDADLTLSAGSLDVDGDFGVMDVEVGAGRLEITGAASSIDLDMSAGRADLELDGVGAADLAVSAGDLVVELLGAAPDQVTIGVSAGSLDLTVPAAEYRILQEVSAGSFDATVDQSSSAQRVIDATVSAGSVTVRPGD